MKRNLFLILVCIASYGYGQTSCPFDESLFSGTLTVTTAGASKTKASDATSNHRFGERVAIDGNIAAVVSRSNGAAAGKVYIFTNDGSGNWTEQTILSASDGFAGDNFGSAIALEGNYLLVGARSQLDAADVDTGAAYLFEYNGVNTWTEVAIFEPSDGTTGIRYGESVSIEGDLVLVGARNGCTGGCAYLYENDGTNTFTYTETKLEPQVQSNYDGARFGHDVLVKDGRAYVSGPQDFSAVGNASAGSVQIWDQANDGTWSRTHRLRGTETTEAFGWSIDVEGDYLAIGAMNFETSTTPEADQGRVYVYKADANGDYLEANSVMIQNDDKDSFNDQRFGTDVALDGEYLYVGTFGNGAINSDALYTFKGNGTNNWTQIAKITSGAGWDEFANRAVAVSFPYLLIGQNEDDSPSNSGAIYFVPLANQVVPVASVTETVGVNTGQNNGIIKVSFDDEATETQIKFSVDGGTTYPYTFDDTLGNAEITNLAIGNYDVWVAFDESSCPISLGSFAINEIPYTAIPDANFEAALEALGYDDVSADGQVPTALIEVVTTLDVTNQSISDLTGISDFTALVNLDCSDNTLTSLDVSANMNLQTLEFNNNSIASVMLGANTTLDYIRGRYNQLSTIDISQNTNLTFLNLRSNLLTTIDVSNNTLLETINLRDHTNLTGIDITNNVNLKTLYLQDTDINSLDVSQNNLLEILSILRANITSIDVSNLTALTQLRISDNNLTKLDVSNNPALISLECANNNLTFLNAKNGNNTAILDADFNASGNTALTCILVDNAAWSTTNWTNIDTGVASFSDAYCRYTAIPDANFEAELEALGYDDISADGQVPTALIETVTALNVRNKSISDLTGIEDFTALTNLNCGENSLTILNISNNTTLEMLTANGNNITSIDLSNNLNLKEVDLGANELSALDISANTALTKLECPVNDIAVLDISNNIALEILEAFQTDIAAIDLSTNINLKKLRLYKTNITEIDVSNNPLLNELRIDNTDVSTLDITNNVLLDWLKVNGSLITSLDLTGLTVLTRFEGQTGVLEHIDIRNGNNSNMTTFNVTNNNNLDCVLVDDAAYSTTYWAQVGTGLIFSETYCRYTAIPDANFEAALEALGYDDIAADGQVPTALIEVVEDLDVESANIADITGIEDFIALKTFDCGYNSLSTIDVTNNTELRQLIIRNNNISSIDLSANTLLVGFKSESCPIANLDLSNNINLQVLWLTGNDLTTLDVSNNTLLRSFYGNNNQLTTLDLTNNPALQVVRASNNNLESFDLRNGNNTNISGGTNFQLTGNSNSICVFVDDLAHATTNWTTIDSLVTFRDSNYCRYTAIPDANFEARLEALGYDDISGDGQVPTALIEVVTTLDINSQSIADITGIEDFTALEELYATLNTFTSLDLSNNTALKILWTKFTPIATINLSANTNLEQLVCSFNDLSSLDVSANTALTYLECNNNSIATLDVSTNTALLDLRCGNNALTNIDLTTNTLLTTFWCDNNSITTIDVSLQTALTSFVANDNNLTFVNIQNGNNMNVTNFVAINNSGLTCILVDDATYSTTYWGGIDVTTSFNDQYCRYTAIPDANFEARLEALGYDDISADGQVPTALIEVVTNLNLVNDGITDITGIEDFIALTSLNASDNLIGSLDISNSPNLVTLSANACGLTNLDISQNTLLQNLSADSNQLTSLNTTNNTALKTIVVYGNSIATADFSTNTALETLDLFQNQLTALDLSNNIALKTLFCDNNQLISLNVQNGNNGAITEINTQGNDDLYCVLVDDEAYSNTYWTNLDTQTSYNETSCDFVIVDVDVFLQGALINPITGEESLMRDDLRTAGALYSSNSPYGDGASISETVGLSDNGVNTIVDWIWVELRDANTNTTVVAGQSGVLQRDGDIVATNDDLVTPLTFENVPAGNYYIVVKHRNHLSIMSATAITLRQVVTTINFTDANNQITFGSNAQTTFGMPTDIVAMWSGNANEDSIVQYSGTNPDTPDILSTVLNDAGNFLNFPTYVVTGYNANDINMDGNTQYSGTEPDVPFILQNILTHPNNFLGFSTYQIIEQLPENE
ncbi:hypothetical protein [uncultured Kordia sp.]|uniref:hypothetical protein n=1 Tax=uncultured Kordia sp. TaxID=507699 RepID=UPI002602D072|nr:hypothetical protein [uncultured Kordia sp.]